MPELANMRLGVVGLGLIGGSLSLALGRQQAVAHISGWDLCPEHRRQAQSLQLVDRVVDTPAELASCHTVFLAVPVAQLLPVARELLPRLSAGAIVTDGGSVKAPLVAQMAQLLPPEVVFVPGHPIAGTEKSGPQAAFPELFQGRRCVLTPADSCPQGAVGLVKQMWQAAGARVVLMEAQEHDRLFAAVSHLPHMVAYALVHAVAASIGEELLADYSAGGFRDFTRIASSNPVMWRDIALSNRQQLLQALDSFEASLQDLRQALEEEDGSRLEAEFSHAKRLRDGLG